MQTTSDRPWRGFRSRIASFFIGRRSELDSYRFPRDPGALLGHQQVYRYAYDMLQDQDAAVLATRRAFKQFEKDWSPSDTQPVTLCVVEAQEAVWAVMCQEYDESRRCGSAFQGPIKYEEVEELPVGAVLRRIEPKRRWLMTEAIVARVDQPALPLPWETDNAEPDFGR